MSAAHAAASLAGRVLAGDRRAVARAITLVENGHQDAARLVEELFGRTGRAHVIGVTGPPGAGKSTLVDRLVASFLARTDGADRSRLRVGVIAVDPTSPFTGGAVLGDRLRMQAHAVEPGVFIRSMATRGQLGGLARATGDAVLVLDAAGCDVVVVETVGVGQDEVDIARAADVCVVTLVPGAGDDVQALKAGVMEIADVFVVNKADREGADRLAAEVESSLGLADAGAGAWRPPVLRTVAVRGEGIQAVLDALDAFRAWAAGGEAAARRRRRDEQALHTWLLVGFLDHLRISASEAGLEAWVDRIAAREIDPHTAAREILARVAKPSA